MRRTGRGWRLPTTAVVTAVLGIALTLAGCSSDDADPGATSAGQEQKGVDPGAGDGGTVLADASTDSEPPDISAEVGDLHPEGAYVEEPLDDAEPAPPESVVEVLCNLNSTYLAELADLGMSDDGANLPFVALSLNDNIQVWETLVGHHPEARGDVDRAKQIHNYWREAMAHQEVGDSAAVEDLFRKADAEIAELSDPESAEELGCGAE